MNGVVFAGVLGGLYMIRVEERKRLLGGWDMISVFFFLRKSRERFGLFSPYMLFLFVLVSCCLELFTFFSCLKIILGIGGKTGICKRWKGQKIDIWRGYGWLIQNINNKKRRLDPFFMFSLKVSFLGLGLGARVDDTIFVSF